MSQTLYPQLLRNTRPMTPMSIRNLRCQSPPLHNALFRIELINSIANRNENMSLSPGDGDRSRDRDFNSGDHYLSLGFGLGLFLLGFFENLYCVNEWHARRIGWRNSGSGPR